MKYIDLHCDTIGRMYEAQKDDHLKNAALQVNLEFLKRGNCLLQCFAMYVPFHVPNPFETCMDMIDCYYRQIEQNADMIRPVLNKEDLFKNEREGKISALLTIEEGGVVKNHLSFLRDFHRLGVRMICLNWNFVNGIGHPNVTVSKDGKVNDRIPNTEEGLTEFGFMMVREMNRLRMIVDVSHLSDKGFYDVIQTSAFPIVASHSNARGVCSHVRNLTDEMILLLAKKGGVMGMNFCADFLDDDVKRGKNTIDCVIRHMKYIRALAGIDVLALGTDFDGIDPEIEMKNASMMPRLFQRMKEEGFTDEEIEKVAYKNFLRVMQAVL